MDTSTSSRKLFQYLSRLFGSEKAVRVRRLFYSVDDCCHVRTLFRAVNSGSKAEGLDFPGSDLDVMFIYTNESVFPDLRSCPQNDSHSFYISTDDTPPGFAHINNQCAKTTKLTILMGCKREQIIYAENGAKLQNSLFKNICFDERFTYIYKQHGPCISTLDNTYDFMFAFELNCWPNVASAWISRPRLFDWPPSSLISNIVHASVLLVPIGSKFGSMQDNPNEWRISFSLAEKLLVLSFNHTQLMCYAMLKILLKEILNKIEIIKDVLFSYFMKTIVFWTIEETGCSVWTPDNLVTCFRSCLMKLSYLLRQQQIPNYFIPENNMVEGKFSEDSLSTLCIILDLVNSEGISFTLRTETLQDFLTTVNGKMYIECQDDEVSVLCSLINCSQSKHSFKLRDLSPRPQTMFHLLNIFKSKLLRTVLFFRFVDEMSAVAITLDYDLNKSNKRLYGNFKNLIGYGLIGSHSGLLSWLVVAIIFYSHKNYMTTLRIADFINSENTLMKRFSSRDVSTVRGIMSFLQRFKLSNCGSFAGRIHIVPSTNAIISETDLSRPFSYQPVVLSRLFLTFIRFMSFHHLKNFSMRKIVLFDILAEWEEINERTHSLYLHDGIFVIKACAISHKSPPDSLKSKLTTCIRQQVGDETFKYLLRDPLILSKVNGLWRNIFE